MKYGWYLNQNHEKHKENYEECLEMMQFEK